MSDTPATNQEVMEAVVELRSVFDAKNLDNSEVKGKVDKINDFLDKQEDLNQKALLAETQAKKDLDEMKERYEALEISMAHTGDKSGKNYKESPEYKALNAFCMDGDVRMDDEHKALLRTDSDASGGYLVNDPEFEIQKLGQAGICHRTR